MLEYLEELRGVGDEAEGRSASGDSTGTESAKLIEGDRGPSISSAVLPPGYHRGS